MTYGRFLLFFLGIPTVLLAVGLRGRIQRSQRIALLIVCLLAFFYTTPWDNFAAYKNLWSFAPEFVWGRPLWFGYLPLEEYLFYLAEAIFVCFAVVFSYRLPWLRTREENDAVR